MASQELSEYEKLLAKGKAPSLKDLILSQTWMHDHLLSDPNKIRKFFSETKLGCSNLPEHDFLDERDGYSDDDAHEKAHKVRSAMNKDLKNLMFWYQKDISQSNFSCCKKYITYYMGLKRDESDIKVVCRSIEHTSCSDYGGGDYYYEDTIKDTEDFAESVKTVLTKGPGLILLFDLEDDVDLLLKAVE